MATKRVTLSKSNGTTSSFDFTIPEQEGTYNLKFTLDAYESKSQTVSGTGIQDSTQGGLISAYHYNYSVNIGLGATAVTISLSTVSGTTNTVSYNSSTGVASGTIYSIKSNVSATLSWRTPKVINAGNITVGATANTYRLSFGMSDGSTINAGTFTTPAIAPKEETFSVTTPSFTFDVATLSGGNPMTGLIYSGSGTSSTITYAAKQSPSSVVLNGVTLSSTDTQIDSWMITSSTAGGLITITGTAKAFAKVVGNTISIYISATASVVNTTGTMTVPAKTYSGTINY